MKFEIMLEYECNNLDEVIGSERLVEENGVELGKCTDCAYVDVIRAGYFVHEIEAPNLEAVVKVDLKGRKLQAVGATKGYINEWEVMKSMNKEKMLKVVRDSNVVVFQTTQGERMFHRGNKGFWKLDSFMGDMLYSDEELVNNMTDAMEILFVEGF